MVVFVSMPFKFGLSDAHDVLRPSLERKKEQEKGEKFFHLSRVG